MRTAGLIIATGGVLAMALGGLLLAVAIIGNEEPDSASLVPQRNAPSLFPQWTAPDLIYFRRGTEIWTVTPDGRETTLVFAGARAGYSGTYLLGDTGIAPSPNGDIVAFLDENGAIAVIDSLGHEGRPVSDLPKPADSTYYATRNLISGWSPDGTKLIYFVGQDGEERKAPPPDVGFYLFDIATGKRSKLEKLSNFRMWSDDGTSLIYEGSVENADGGHWFRYDLKDASSTRLTREPFACLPQASPHSPSGELLYACANTQGNESALVLADYDNTNQRVLKHGASAAELQFPMFSPNGELFIYRHQSPPGAGGVPTFEVRLYELASNSDRVLARGCAFARTWLNQSSILLEEYQSCGEGGKPDLYRLDLESGDKTLLASQVEAH